MRTTSNAFRIKGYLCCLLFFVIGLNESNAQTPVLGHAALIGSGAFGTYLVGPTAIEIKGNYAFVLTMSSLQVIDISNSSSPVVAGSMMNEKGMFDDARSMAISGDYAFITSFYNSKLVIIDISNPLKPVFKVSISNQDHGAKLSFPENITISGNFAYILNMGDNSLEIIDITTPLVPIHAGRVSDGVEGVVLKTPRSVVVQGNNVYIASETSNSLEIIDVSNPFLPKYKARLIDGQDGAVLGQPCSVTLHDSYAYVTGRLTSSLEIINITNPSVPRHAGSITDGTEGAMLQFPESVFISGDHAFVTSAVSDALEIINISDPANPVHIGNIKNGDGKALIDFPVDVFVSNSVAYVISSGSASLELVDVSNSEVPVHLSNIKNGDGGVVMGGPSSVVISGNYAYVACKSSNSLAIIDITIPSKPLLGGQIVDGTNGAQLYGAVSVSLSRGYAFVASRWAHALEIIDVSDPTHPTHASTLADGEGGAVLSDPFSVFVSGNYAFVCNTYINILEIIDVSNPLRPAHIASMGTSVFPNAVYVEGNYAYLVTSNSFRIIDISNPSAPYIVSSIVNGMDGAIISGGSSVYLSDGFAYVTSAFTNSIEIIDISNALLPRHAGSVNVPEAPHGVFVVGNFAYVACTEDNSLVVMDISDKTKSVFVSKLVDGQSGAIMSQPISLFVNNNYCYVTGGLLEIVDLNALPPPQELHTTDSTSQSFRALWRKESGASKYFVDLFTANYYPVEGFYNVPVSDTSILFTGLQAMTHYYYRVRSFNGVSTSLNSKQMHVFTFVTPTALPATEIISGSFVANWSEVNNIPNEYSFDISPDEDFARVFNVTIPGEYNAVKIEQLAEGTYYYRVRAGGYYLLDGISVAFSPNSNIVKVMISTITGISDQDEETEMEVFPNPARNEVNILFKGFDNCCEINFSIHDVTGRVILESSGKNSNSLLIPLINFAEGYYFIKAVQNNRQLVKKFLKY